MSLWCFGVLEQVILAFLGARICYSSVSGGSNIPFKCFWALEYVILGFPGARI